MRTLRLHVKHRLGKKEERIFVIRRLKLFDERHCLSLQQKLWRSYIDLSSTYDTWPKYVTQKINGFDDNNIKMMIESYFNDIEIALHQTKEQISAQSLTCPTTLSLQSMDELLKDFVTVHQRRYTRKINCSLAQFRTQIQDHQLWLKLSSYQMTIEQVE